MTLPDNTVTAKECISSPYADEEEKIKKGAGTEANEVRKVCVCVCADSKVLNHKVINWHLAHAWPYIHWS